MNAAGPTFVFLDWLAVVLYLASMVAIAYATAAKQRGLDGFFLGERKMPVWAVALSVLATALSAATFIGVPQIAFEGDLSYLILNLGGIVAAFIVAFAFIPPIYRCGTTTIYGYLGLRFGGAAAVTASFMFLFGRLLASGARLYMAAIAFSLAFYGDIAVNHLVAAIVVLGGIGTVYTACGGIKGVIWTDVVQISVVVLAAVMAIGLLLHAIPLPLSGVIAALRDANGVNKLKIVDMRFDWGLNYTLWTGLIAGAFMATASYGTDHDMAQRLITTKSALRGSAAMIISTILGIPVVLLFLIIGLLLSIYYGRPDLMGSAFPTDVIDDTRKVFPQFLLNHLPHGFRGLSMIGLFAAAMGSFISAINAMASSAVADIYLPWMRARGRQVGEEVRLSRWMVVLMGVLLVVFAIGAIFAQSAGQQTLIDFALGVMAFALAPLLGVFSAALFTRRGTLRTYHAALIVGVVTVVLLQPYMLPRWLDFKLAWPWVWVIAAPLSFVVCVTGGVAAQDGKEMTQ